MGRLVSYRDRRSLDAAERRDLMVTMGAVSLLTLGVLIGVLLLMRRILRPPRQAATAVGALSEGRTDTALPIARGQDEVAGMIRATGLRDGLASADLAPRGGSLGAGSGGGRLPRRAGPAATDLERRVGKSPPRRSLGEQCRGGRGHGRHRGAGDRPAVQPGR